MSEFLTTEKAELINDEAERTFATALLASFPNLSVNHQYGITAQSGNRSRLTVADFRLLDSDGEELFVEVASGNKATKRKKRQHRTANLAGVGERHVTLYGRDVNELKTPGVDLKSKLIAILSGRYNKKLFKLE